MSKYLLLVKGGDGILFNKLAMSEKNDWLVKWGEWLEQLKKDKHLVTGSPLCQDGQVFYSSGCIENVPDNYEMISEIITGFCVLKTESKDQAIKIAENCPLLENGRVSCELRSFKDIR